MKEKLNVKNIVDMDLSNPRTVAHTIQKIIDYISGHAEEIKGEKGVGISNIEVTEQLELLFTLTDGTTRLTSMMNIQNGVDGVGIENIIWNTEQSKFSIYLTDGSVYTSPSLKGDKGDKGDRGVKGDTGLKGEKGDTGLKGDTGVDGSSIYTTSSYLGTGNGRIQLSTISVPSGKEVKVGDIIITNNSQTKGRMSKVMYIDGDYAVCQYWTNLNQTSLEVVEIPFVWNDTEKVLEFNEMFIDGKMYVLEWFVDDGFNGHISFIYQPNSIGSYIGFIITQLYMRNGGVDIKSFNIRNNTETGKGIVSDDYNLGEDGWIKIYKVG